MTKFLVPIIESNYGSFRCETLEEAQKIDAKHFNGSWLDRVHWHHLSITIGDIEDTEAPGQLVQQSEPEPLVPAEILLVLISEILWPPQCPSEPWDVEMVKRVANLLIAHRPELTPTESAAVTPLMEECCG